MTTTRRRGANRPGLRSTRGRPVRGGAGAVPWWRRWVLPAALAVVTVLALVLYFTPLLGVRAVEVTGNRTLSQDEIVRTAGIDPGTPMLRVDTEDVASRLRAIRKVADVRVSLSWPTTVRVEVTERAPAAFLVARDGIQLVDSAGVPFQVVKDPPADLPELHVRRVAPDDPATRAAMTVLTALPPALRADVLAVDAQDPGDIHLRLKGDREVQWGDTDESDRKAAILPPLLTRPGSVYDVTAPSLPTVS